MPRLVDIEACASDSEYVSYTSQNAGLGVCDRPAASAGLEECFLEGLGKFPHANDSAVQFVPDLEVTQALAVAEAKLHQSCSSPCHWVGGASDLCRKLIGSSGAEALESHSERFNEREHSCFKHDWCITNVLQHKLEGSVAEERLSGAEECNTEGLHGSLMQDFDVIHSPSQQQVIKAVMEITALKQSTGLMLAQCRETASIDIAQQEEENQRQQAQLKNPRRQVTHGHAVSGNLKSTTAHQSVEDVQGQVQPSFSQDLRIRNIAMVRGITDTQAAKGSARWVPNGPAIDGRSDALDRSPEKLLSEREVQTIKQGLMAANATEGALPAGHACAHLMRVAAQQPRTRSSSGAQLRMLRT